MKLSYETFVRHDPARQHHQLPPGGTRANNAILSLGGGNFTALLDSARPKRLILDVNGYFQ
jgi:hypothetical protein